MSRCRDVEPKVREILMAFPETRNNDRELVMRVYQKFYHVYLTDPFVSVMRRKDVPPFETIRRTRQKLQADNEELRAETSVVDYRCKEEIEYRNYATKGE